MQQLPLKWDVGVDYHQNYFGWVKPVTGIPSRFSPGAMWMWLPKKCSKKAGSLQSLQKWFRWKWLRKRRPEGSEGQGHNLRNLSIKDLRCLLNRNLVFVPEWIYPGYLEDDRGSIETCFVSTGCTDLYVITTVMAGFVILRGFFSATIIPQKQSQQATAWVPMFSNLTQKNGTTKHLQSIMSCSEAHAVIIVDTQAEPALVGYCSSDVSQKVERGKGISFIWVMSGNWRFKWSFLISFCTSSSQLL